MDQAPSTGTAVPDAQVSPAPEGAVRRVSQDAIEGWARDRSRPEERVTVVLETDDGEKVSVVADRYRRDVEEAGIGDGRHGFLLPVPERFLDGTVHHFRVRMSGAPRLLRRGAFDFGPFWPVDCPIFSEDPAAPQVTHSVSPNQAFPGLVVALGVTLRLVFRLPGLTNEANVTLNILRIEGGPPDARYLLHTREGGTGELRPIRVRKEEDGDRWSVAFRIQRADQGGTGPEVDESLPEESVSLVVSLRPVLDGAVLDAFDLALPIWSQVISPPMATMLDRGPRVRASYHDAMRYAPREEGARRIERLADRMPGYIAPRLAVLADEVTELDLACVADLLPLRPDPGEGEALAFRPDAVVIQASRAVREAKADPAFAADLVKLLATLSLVEARTIVLNDLEDANQEAGIGWLFGAADRVVGFGTDGYRPDPSGADDAKFLHWRAVVAPGRVNPFAARRARERAAAAPGARSLVDGFWDLVDLLDGSVASAIAERQAGLHVVDSSFSFSMFRVGNLGEFYWNLLGAIEPAERAALLARYDELLLLPVSSKSPFNRERLLLEAASLLCFPEPIIAPGGEHAFASAFRHLFGTDVKKIAGLPPTERNRLLARWRRKCLADHNIVDLLHAILADHRPALVAHNRAALRPKITGLLVTKRPDLVDQAIAGFARQTYANRELIVILHGCEVPPDRIARWAALDGVSAVRSVPRHQTLGACLNLGVSLASGTLIAKIDDDDIYGAHHLSDAVLDMQCAPADVYSRPLEFIYLVPEARMLHRQDAGLQYSSWEAAEVPGFAGTGGTLIVRRETALATGFSEERRGGLDSDFVTRAVRQGHAFMLGGGFGYALCRHGEEGGHTWRVDTPSLERKSVLLGDRMDAGAVQAVIDPAVGPD